MRTCLFISLALLFVLASGTPSSFYRYCSHNSSDASRGHFGHHGGEGHWGSHGGEHHGGEGHWGPHGGENSGNWGQHHGGENPGNWGQHHGGENSGHPQAPHPQPIPTLKSINVYLSEPKGAQMIPTSHQMPQHPHAQPEHSQQDAKCSISALVIGKRKLVISNPQLFPWVIMGIFIGMVLLLLTTKSIRLPHGAPISYASVFFFFTIMNVSALLFFCMLPSTGSRIASQITIFSEGFATSCIGLSLFIAAVVDAGIAKDCSLFKLAFTIIGYLIILYSWVQSLFFTPFWPHSALMLYFGLPIAGFVCYYLVQTVWLFRNQSQAGAPYLILSFMAFVVAFAAEVVNIHNCLLLPTYFNGEVIWFFCLNLSFFFLFRYYVTRGLTPNPPAYSELAEEQTKVVDAESGTIEALYPQSTIETKR